MTSKKVIKEIIIMLLVCLITMLIFAIGFYDFIPNRKTVAEVKNYEASETVQVLLQDNIDSVNNSEVILSYEVTSSDLNNYQSTNEYVPGKANPFAAASSSSVGSGDGNDTGTSGNTANNNQATNTEGNTTSSGYFKDTGTK